MSSSQRLFNVYGDPRTKEGQRHLIVYTVINKIEIFPKKIYLNIDMVKPLEGALKKIIDNGLTHLINTYDGCYNLRPIRGLEKKYIEAMKKNDVENQIKCLSAHCWGTAIDINAAWNQLNQEPTISIDIVNCFKQFGFEWGGDFHRKDGMHFQFIP